MNGHANTRLRLIFASAAVVLAVAGCLEPAEPKAGRTVLQL